jgi:ABC-type Fe3+/spermidine/putrescine transport system ATPase subunit
MVFQDYALFPHLNVRQNVAYGLKLRGIRGREADSRVEEMLALVQLPGYANARPSQLSGGQRQRVALDRALAVKPQVMLMDEPLSNLDVKLRQELRTQIKEIQASTGVTTVFVTHDQLEAMSLSDRVVVMRDGRVEQIGAPAELYERPTNEFVAAFVGDANIIRLDDGTRMEKVGIRLDPGDRARLSVSRSLVLRPERVRIVSPGDIGAANTAAGVIQAVEYFGSSIRYGVDVDGDFHMVVDVMTRDGHALRHGERVGLSWLRDDLTPVRRDNSA